jgi:hypothetical protein
VNYKQGDIITHKDGYKIRVTCQSDTCVTGYVVFKNGNLDWLPSNFEKKDIIQKEQNEEVTL